MLQQRDSVIESALVAGVAGIIISCICYFFAFTRVSYKYLEDVSEIEK